VHIPKGDGKTRPIGIPTFEDKVLQRAVVMVLEAVYEQDFRDCSYGFRPGRSAHQMVEDLWQELMSMGGAWVLELDIRSYFDTIDHAHVRAFLDQRVRDGVIRRSIDKWLKAGVLEDGQVHHPEEGTPQGGVISPLLANLFLHEVLDKWFEDDVRPRMGGRVRLFRYADDAVLVFSSERDARRVLEVLPKRFAKYGLTLHPDKTRLVYFYPPSYPKPKDGPPDDAFDLLGFTHHWKKSRRGRWIIARRTARKRFTRSLKAVADWCRRNRHRKLSEQYKPLASKLRGHYQYYGITGNFERLAQFYHSVKRVWQKWLNRRSQRGGMSWEKWNRLEKKYPLPLPRVVHSVLTGAARP
jgi:group II intron reverse transcriptase/maturase